jgi:uncharacterized membrane-anchored protein YjiN (DUF445 family)
VVDIPSELSPGARVRLRRMKRNATGLLLLVAAIYLATFALPDRTWVGFVRAAAEAGMVGGLADWFAVTALFRHPLGLPIPHTALVPTRKNALALSLGQFVTGHFLTSEIVRARLREADLVRRVASWLAAPERSATIVREAARAVRALLDSFSADDVARLGLDLVRRDAEQRSYSSAIGRLLEGLLSEGTHRPLVDIIVGRARRWLGQNRGPLVPALKSVIENAGAIAYLWVSDRKVEKLLDAAEALALEVELDPEHELRQSFERLLHELAADLQAGGDAAKRLDAMVDRFLADPRTLRWLRDVLDGGLGTLRELLDDPSSDVVHRIAGAIHDFAKRVETDAEFRARLEDATERAVGYAVENYASEFTRLVEDTVARWDARDAADRIEVAVGRDLQFIRINGTVVGSLAGIAIHVVALLVG